MIYVPNHPWFWCVSRLRMCDNWIQLRREDGSFSLTDEKTVQALQSFLELLSMSQQLVLWREPTYPICIHLGNREIIFKSTFKRGHVSPKFQHRVVRKVLRNQLSSRLFVLAGHHFQSDFIGCGWHLWEICSRFRRQTQFCHMRHDVFWKILHVKTSGGVTVGPCQSVWEYSFLYGLPETWLES